VQFGVRQEELDREIQETRVQLQTAAAQASTRRTPNIANEIVQTLDDDEVYTSPAQDLEMFEAQVKGLKAQDVSAVLRERVFVGEGPLVFMASPLPIDGGEAAFSKAFFDSRAKAVEAPQQLAAKAWPYARFGQPGKVVEQKEIADLGASMIRFANGVRLTVKPTTFRKDQVLVRVRVGHGQIDMPRDRVTPAWAARSAFIEGGLKDLTTEDMEQILASNVYGADFSTADDAFVLQGSTRPEDLDVQLQVLTAYLTAPGWRPEAFQRIRNFRSTQLDQLEATPSGVLNRDLGKLMHGGDPRFAFPSKAEIASATPEAFKALFSPRLAAGPIEVIVIGDISVDKAIALTASTLGALQPRAPAPASADGRAVSLPAPGAEPVMLSHKGRADQAIAYAEWPTQGFFADPQEARTLRVLAQVLENRLVDDLREAAGVTYSPQAGANASLVFPSYGYVSAVVEIPPGKIADFYGDLTKIAADLRAKDVSDDELERAKKPLVEQLEKARQTNDYWLEQLSGVHDEPRKLDAVRTVVQSLQSVDAAMIRKAAGAYLLDTRQWKLEVTPQALGAAPAAAAAQ
jgi:zinc protease